MTYVILSLITLVILFFVANRESSQTSNTPNHIKGAYSNNFSYWADYKSRNPIIAKEIEQLTGRDISRLDNASAYQIVTTLLRWSRNANVSVGELKAYFLGEINKFISQGGSYEMFISKLTEEKVKEAHQFSISQDFTACNFMIEFIEEERQKNSSDYMSRHIEEQLNRDTDKKEHLTRSVEKYAEELNLSPDISNLNREENKLFKLAEEGARMLDNLTIGIYDNVKLSQAGFAEARILCSIFVIDLHSNFKNEINLDVPTDRFFLLLADATICDIKNIADPIGFINSRIAFFKKQVSIANSLNVLQRLQPTSPLAKIFRILYLHPECENPEIIKADEVTPNNIIMFKGQFEKVVRHLQITRDKICGIHPDNEGNQLQYEIEDTLMLLFPEAKRSYMDQNVASVLTEVILDQLKNGTLESSISVVMPLDIRNRFSQLALKIQKYSANHTDIEEILAEAQTNTIKKFGH